MAKKKPEEITDHVDGSSTQEAIVATATSPSTWDGAVMIPLGQLIFTAWNVNEMDDQEFSELVAEIEEGGFDEPCDIIPSKDKEGCFIVLGGEHRVRAAHALEMKEVPCVIKKHLIDADEATLKMWSVKRNHIRGRVNMQKYMDLERGLNEKHKIKAEAARQKMLIKGDLLKSLKKSDDETAAKGQQGEDTGPRQSGGAETDGEKDEKQETRDRKSLLAALKTAEEKVLIDSADTVQHGYLFFTQGNSGQLHLVVDESPRLAALIKRTIAACKKESAKVDDLICSALVAELPKWEK